MTHRVTLDVPATGIQYGIPYVSSDDANSTVVLNDTGSATTSWSGVEITHQKEPGQTGTASVAVYKQSDDSLVAENATQGTLYLYYPNNPEYANANLTSNQGVCEWDTYYYLDVTPNTPADRREMIAIRKLTTTTPLNS
jgi:hypothetical protein